MLIEMVSTVIFNGYIAEMHFKNLKSNERCAVHLSEVSVLQYFLSSILYLLHFHGNCVLDLPGTKD